MTSIFLLGAVICQIATLTGAVRMPSYLKACSKTHNFNECAMESAKFAIPHLIHGDRKLGLPSFAPLEISLIEVKGSGDFKVRLMNLKVYGLENSKPIKVDVDFAKRKAHILSTVPKLFVEGDYSIEGHILIFSLRGKGPANLTMTDGTYTYDFEWELENIRGTDYGKIIKSNFDYELKKIEYHFLNIIPNNPSASQKINEVLNKNWETVNEDLKPSVQKALLIIHDQMFSKIFSQIPMKQLFKD